MNQRSKYKTQQREALINYLRTTQGSHVTAGDVCEYFKAKDASIGQATVYRQLEQLVSEGMLNKYTIDAGSPACFEYMEPDSHAPGESCFHLRCEKCGKLFHLHCGELDQIGGHLFAEHGFRLDPVRTVFYGVCEDCAASRG